MTLIQLAKKQFGSKAFERKLSPHVVRLLRDIDQLNSTTRPVSRKDIELALR